MKFSPKDLASGNITLHLNSDLPEVDQPAGRLESLANITAMFKRMNPTGQETRLRVAWYGFELQPL